MMEFDSKNNLYKLETLNKLQKLQIIYCGFVDMQIETRKDMRITALSFCSYTEEFASKSKLFIYKLSWDKDNTDELKKIEKELDKLSKKY